jgi:hypothetical protein
MDWLIALNKTLKSDSAWSKYFDLAFVNYILPMDNQFQSNDSKEIGQ